MAESEGESMRRASKRDSNEAAIVDALRQAGITVYRLSDPGAPDLMCWRTITPSLGRVLPGPGEPVYIRLLEVKSKHGRLTKAQRAYTGPRWIVRTPEEALAVFGIKA